MPSERLKQTWPSLIAEPQEATNVEFKRSVSWIDYQEKLVRAVLGIANHRDGGFIVIGVAEENRRLVRQGISPEHRATFLDDDVKSYVAGFADPGVALTLSDMEHDGLSYLVLEIAQFREVPVVCRKDSRNFGNDTVLRRGRVYYRTAEDKVQTREATAEDMRTLLELAIDLRVRRDLARYLDVLQAVVTPQVDVSDLYARERGDF